MNSETVTGVEAPLLPHISALLHGGAAVLQLAIFQLSISHVKPHRV